MQEHKFLPSPSIIFITPALLGQQPSNATVLWGKNTSNLILTLAAMLVAFQFLLCVLANCPQQFDRVNGSLVYCALFQQGPQLLVSSAMFVGFKGVYTVE